MIKRVDVIFFVEHKDREMESVQKIIKELNERGISTLVLSVYFHVQFLLKYKARLYVFPFLICDSDWPSEMVYSLYGDRVQYLNMNWEQLISPVNMTYKKPRDYFSRQLVHHVAWNENFREFLFDSGVSDKNVKITGNPANELLYSMLDECDNWRNLFSKRYNLDSEKDWLFMPLNYGWAFSPDRMIRRKIEKGYPSNIAWEHRNYAKLCRDDFIDFIHEVSQMYDFEIIIRPHPTIADYMYEELFLERFGGVPANIKILKDYTIREWIVASDIIGSSWSTSVWDAYSVGKKVFLYTPHARPEWLEVWWNEQVVNIQRPNEIQNSVMSDSVDIQMMESSQLIADFAESLLENVKWEAVQPKYPFDLTMNAKVFRCFVRNCLPKDVTRDALYYDHFRPF